MKIGRNNYFYTRKNMQKGFFTIKKKETNRIKKYETFDCDTGEILNLAYHRSTENNRIKRWCLHSRWSVNKLLCNQLLYR